MEKIYRKRVIGIVLLIVTLVALFIPLQEYFGNRITHNHMRIKGFYLERKNSLDVVVMGASETYYGYYANEAYRNTGITSYPYAVPQNPVTLWKYELKDILRRQNPKVLVVDVNGAGYGSKPKNMRSSEVKNSNGSVEKKVKKPEKKKNLKKRKGSKLYSQIAFRVLGKMMPKSDNKKEMIKDLSRFNKESKVDKAIPFLKYHGHFYENMSSDLEKLKKRGYTSMKGVFSRHRTRPFDDEIDVPHDLKPLPMDSVAEKKLKEFIKISKDMGVKKILFIRFPHRITNEKHIMQYQRYMSVDNLVKAYGYDYLDCTQLRDEIGLSSKKDFVDSDHLAATGAKKFTTYLSKYIQEKYKLKSSKLPSNEKEKWDEGVKLIDAYYKYYNDYPNKHSKLNMLYKTFPESEALRNELEKNYMDD